MLNSPVTAAQVASAWTAGAVNDVWADNANWDTAVFPNNGSDTYLVSIDSGAGGAVVSLDVNATIDTLFIGGNDELGINNNKSLSIVGPSAGALLTNNGTLSLNSIGNPSNLTIATGSISGSGEIVMGNNTQNRLLSDGGTLTQLSGHTIRGGGTFLANTGGFVNQGSIIADQTTALTIDPNANGFLNEGVFQATGTGGLNFLTGVYTNTGQTIDVANGSQLKLNAGVEIIGGNLQTTGTGVIRVVGSTPILDSVGLFGVLDIQNNTAITVKGFIENQDTILMSSIGNQTTLNFEGTQTLGGAGQLMMSDNGANRILSNNVVVTNGSGHTIRGAGQLLANTGGMINNGTIVAEGSVALTIDPNGLGFENNGTLQASGTGGLTFNGGVYTNTGETIDVADGSFLRIGSGVSMLGGTLTTTGTGQVVTTTSKPLLNGVTLDGTFNLTNNTSIEIQNGFTNNGTLNANSIGNTTDIDFTGAQTFGGTGTIVLSNNGFNRITTDNTVLTLGANQTLRGAGQLLANTGGMINLGTILQEGSVALTIDPNGLGFDNQATLKATGTGGITLNTGDYTNTGRTIEISDGSALRLNNGVKITEGTLKTLGTGEVTVSSSTPTLDTVVLDGVLNLPNNRSVTVLDGITNNGTINLGSIGNTTDLIMSGTPTLTGSGTIVMSNNAFNRIYGAVTHNIINDTNQTIRGAGQLLANLSGMTNRGTILAEGTNTLTIDPNGVGFFNEGLLRAVGTGGIRFNAGHFTNTGNTIEIEDGSKLEILNGTEILGGSLEATGSGTGTVVVISSTPTLDAVTLDADLTLNNNLSLSLKNGLTNNETLSMNSIGNHTNLIFTPYSLSGVSGVADGTSGALLDGSGEVVMTNNANNRIYASSGLLVLESNQTIRGSGQLLINTSGLYHKGTILAEGSSALTIDPDNFGFTNAGLLRAVGTGGIRLNAGQFTNTGNTIEIEDVSKLEILNGTIITGGTIEATGTNGTGEVRIVNSTPTLDDINLEADLVLNNNLSLNIRNGIVNDATISMNSIGNHTNLIFEGYSLSGIEKVTLGTTGSFIQGTGEIVMTNNTGNRIYSPGGLLVHGFFHTIRGSGQLMANLGGMDSRGAIIQEGSNALILDPDATGFINRGTLQATGTGGLSFLAGVFDNTGSTIEIFDGSKLNITNGTRVRGGTIQGGGTAVVNVVSSTPILETITLDANLNMNNNLSLQIEGGLTNNGTLNMNSIGNATNLIFIGDQSLGGTGEVVMTNNAQNRIYGSGATITHGAGHTIRGSGQLLVNLGGMINRGDIIANQSNPITIDPSVNHSFVNEGAVEANGVGKVVFLAGMATNAAGGVFRGDNIIDVSAATFANDGIIEPGIGGIGRLNIVGDIPFSSSAELEIEIAGTAQGTQFDFLDVTGGGAVALAGDLKLRLLGFTPDVSDTFTILSTDGSLAGIFDNDTSGVIAFAGGGFFVTYNPQSVVLHSFDPGLAIIPEPRAIAIFFGLFAAFFAAGRRRF